MRIVTKINTALGALITLSVLLNWGALMVVCGMPEAAARRGCES